ncbi:MAG: hypothetical protein HKN89_05125 [Eudoraea sp.]|nr:hypothetical protein [Eudoraea sp.]
MPIKARWEFHGVYYAPIGVVGAAEIRRAQHFMFNPPESIVPKYQIIDARRLERFDLNEMEKFNISANDALLIKKYPGFKVAMITASKTIEKAFTDHIQTSQQLKTKAEMKHFKSIEAAREWIGLPYPKRIDGSGLLGNGDNMSLSLP